MYNRTLALVFTLALSAACGGTKPAKGGGQKGATAAKAAGQTSGATAKAQQASGENQGDMRDGVACDGELEGVAWCDSETALVLCAAGSWYVIDCGQAVSGSFCASDEDTIDCLAGEEVDSE